MHILSCATRGAMKNSKFNVILDSHGQQLFLLHGNKTKDKVSIGPEMDVYQSSS